MLWFSNSGVLQNDLEGSLKHPRFPIGVRPCQLTLTDFSGEALRDPRTALRITGVFLQSHRVSKPQNGDRCSSAECLVKGIWAGRNLGEKRGSKAAPSTRFYPKKGKRDVQRRAAWVRVRLWYFKHGIWLCHPRTPGEYSRAFLPSSSHRGSLLG